MTKNFGGGSFRPNTNKGSFIGMYRIRQLNEQVRQAMIQDGSLKIVDGKEIFTPVNVEGQPPVKPPMPEGFNPKNSKER